MVAMSSTGLRMVSCGAAALVLTLLTAWGFAASSLAVHGASTPAATVALGHVAQSVAAVLLD